MKTITTSSEEETIRAGREMAAELRGVVLLEGNLGAGKTTLARGIVSGIAGADAEQVSSPTFTLIHEYGAGVFHIDLYRLESREEIETLGLFEIFDSAALVLVEWGERLGSLTPFPHTLIRIGRAGDEGRTLQIFSVPRLGVQI